MTRKGGRTEISQAIRPTVERLDLGQRQVGNLLPHIWEKGIAFELFNTLKAQGRYRQQR